MTRDKDIPQRFEQIFLDRVILALEGVEEMGKDIAVVKAEVSYLRDALRREVSTARDTLDGSEGLIVRVAQLQIKVDTLIVQVTDHERIRVLVEQSLQELRDMQVVTQREHLSEIEGRYQVENTDLAGRHKTRTAWVTGILGLLSALATSLWQLWKTHAQK